MGGKVISPKMPVPSMEERRREWGVKTSAQDTRQLNMEEVVTMHKVTKDVLCARFS